LSQAATVRQRRTVGRAVALVDLAAAAYLSAFWYVVLGSTSPLLLPDRSRFSTTILVWLVYVVPVLASAALAWLRPGRLSFVAAAVLPAIALVPMLVGQVRADFFWVVAIAEILLAAAIVTPLVILLRFGSATR
jgi:hypothetical protein